MLFVALENLIYLLAVHLGREQADNPYHRETTYHSDSTTVDGVDGVACQHVNDRQSHTPDEASPDAGGSDATRRDPT